LYALDKAVLRLPRVLFNGIALLRTCASCSCLDSAMMAVTDG
jgi:hypothetical protein